MAPRTILTWPDARLSRVCDPLDAGDDVSGLVEDMFDTMYAAPGRGLAAPQIGVMKRLFITDTTWKSGDRTPMVFVNPRILWTSDECVATEEGCLSIPGVAVTVVRPARVEMAFSDAEGCERRELFEGFAAACVQHELDHLNGVVTFDRLEPQARAAAETVYGGLA